MTLAASAVPKNTTEPLPRGPIIGASGQLSQPYRNWFEKKGTQIGEIISGIDRNAENIVQLETDYTAADGAVTTAYISADAVVAADATAARATLSTTLTAAYQAADTATETAANSYTDSEVTTEATARASADGAAASDRTAIRSEFASADTSTLASANSYTDTEVTAEGAARATAIETVEATIQRPNMLPAEYQLAGRDEYDAGSFQMTLVGVSYAASTNQNPYLNRNAIRVRGDSSQSYARIRLTPANGTTNMILPPGKYAFKVGFRVNNLALTGLRVRVRDASNLVVADNASPSYYLESDGSSTSWDEDVALIAEGILDLSSATGSDYYLELYFDGSTTLTTSHAVFIHRAQLEAAASAATGPGDWSSPTGAYAVVSEIKRAFISDDGKALAQLELTAAAGGDPARLSLLDGDGGSSIALDADEIFFGSDTVFEDTHDTFYTEASSYRYRDRGPFGSSGDLLQWYGPTSVSLNSETKTNGAFALATDGKVYYGDAELAGGVFTASYSGTWSNTSGGGSSFSVSRSINTDGLSGGKTYYTQIINSSNLVPKCSITNPDSVSPTLQATSFSVSETETGTIQTFVTDTTTGRTTTVQAGYTMTRTS